MAHTDDAPARSSSPKHRELGSTSVLLSKSANYASRDTVVQDGDAVVSEDVETEDLGET